MDDSQAACWEATTPQANPMANESWLVYFIGLAWITGGGKKGILKDTLLLVILEKKKNLVNSSDVDNFILMWIAAWCVKGLKDPKPTEMEHFRI